MSRKSSYSENYPQRPSRLSSILRTGFVGFTAGFSFAFIASSIVYLRGGYRGLQLFSLVLQNSGRVGLTFGGFMAIAGGLRH